MSSNYAFADYFKNALDFNQLFSTQRRNIEAISAVNQAVVESAQAISRRQAEVVRDNVESMLKASKEIFTSGSPENNISKQADLAKSIFENTLSNLREITETVTKSSFEAFDALNERAKESLEELSKAANSAPAKKSNK
jgi:phasin family protein